MGKGRNWWHLIRWKSCKKWEKRRIETHLIKRGVYFFPPDFLWQAWVQELLALESVWPHLRDVTQIPVSPEWPARTPLLASTVGPVLWATQAMGPTARTLTRWGYVGPLLETIENHLLRIQVMFPFVPMGFCSAYSSPNGQNCCCHLQ